MVAKEEEKRLSWSEMVSVDTEVGTRDAEGVAEEDV